jgi:hypothetical protein
MKKLFGRILCFFGLHKKYELHYPHGDFAITETVIIECSRCWRILKESIEPIPPPHHPACYCQCNVIPEETADAKNEN